MQRGQPRCKHEFHGGHESGDQHDEDGDADLGGQYPAHQRCGYVAGRQYQERGEAEAQTGRQRRADREQRAQAEELHETGILVAKSGTQDVGWGHGLIVPARSSNSSRWRWK